MTSTFAAFSFCCDSRPNSGMMICRLYRASSSRVKTVALAPPTAPVAAAPSGLPPAIAGTILITVSSFTAVCSCCRSRISSSPIKILTKLRILPCSSSRCFFRSGKFCVSSLTVSWIVPGPTCSRAVLLVNFRNGVGIITVAIVLMLFLSVYIINDLFFFELLLLVEQPAPQMDGILVHNGDDHIGKKGLRGLPVVLRGNGRVFGMRMIDPQQGPVMIQRVGLGCHIILRRDLESSRLVAFLRIVDDEDIDNQPRAVMLLPAKKKAAAFVREGVERVFD